MAYQHALAKFLIFAPLVGMNNHRQFILFVTTLVIGIILFDYLTYACQCNFQILWRHLTRHSSLLWNQCVK